METPSGSGNISPSDGPSNMSSPAPAPGGSIESFTTSAPERVENTATPDTTGRVLLAAFITGVLAIIGNCVQGWQTALVEERRSQSSLEQEDRRFRSSLVLKALEAKTPEAAAHALEFFVQAGFLDDKNGYIRNLATAPDKVPIFSPVGAAGRFVFDADLESYCKSTAATYDPKREGCWDGVKLVQIDKASVCRFFTGSSDYTYESAAGAVYCHGQGPERKSGK